jgi:hypothetical protein
MSSNDRIAGQIPAERILDEEKLEKAEPSDCIIAPIK